ncbi:MAG: preprotein translocase subunit SecG [Candidatus Omnitrophota bacterium]
MFILFLIIHVISCVVLIAVILLQAGRGGGLSEAFGGEAQSLMGTHAPIVLKKATTISAIAFLLTSLLLGMITARRSRSLFQRQMLPVTQEGTVPAMPVAEPVSQPEESQQTTEAK